MLLDQAGANGETLEWMQTVWSSLLLRGGVLFDADGQVGAAFGQPSMGLPFGRGFILDREGRVETPYFGHDPAFAIARIHELLATTDAGDDPHESAGAAGGAGPTARVLPNPGRAGLTIACDLPAAGALRLEIFDPAGRLVRRLAREAVVAAGGRHYPWDGRDERGMLVSAGTYLYRLEAAGGRWSGRLALVR